MKTSAKILTISTLVFFSFLFANHAYAAITFTTSNLTATSVTLKASGLTSSVPYRMDLKDTTASPNTTQTKTIPAVSSYENTFTLKSGHNYKASLYRTDIGEVEKEITFTAETAAIPFLSSDPKETSVTIKISNFPASSQVTLYLSKVNPSAVVKTQIVTTDSAGAKSYTFSEPPLEPGTSYRVYGVASGQSVANAPFTAFKTTGNSTAPPPPPPPPPSPPPAPTTNQTPTYIPSPADKGGGLIPPCTVNKETGECVWGWNELMKLISTVIDFLIFYLSLPIAAIAFAYAGFLFMTSGDNASKRSQAKSIFIKVGTGLVIAMAAWLIVNTILTTLVPDLKTYSLLEGL